MIFLIFCTIFIIPLKGFTVSSKEANNFLFRSKRTSGALGLEGRTVDIFLDSKEDFI